MATITAEHVELQQQFWARPPGRQRFRFQKKRFPGSRYGCAMPAIALTRWTGERGKGAHRATSARCQREESERVSERASEGESDRVIERDGRPSVEKSRTTPQAAPRASYPAQSPRACRIRPGSSPPHQDRQGPAPPHTVAPPHIIVAPPHILVAPPHIFVAPQHILVAPPHLGTRATA
jgi:hypothetical protein